MILHVVRKDLRLLWPLGVACTLLQAVLALLEYRPESFAASEGGNAAAMILSLSTGIGLVLTILLVVQQDALPGVNQDWLTRPIRRRDLLIAKILFVLFIIHGPIVAFHFVRGIAEGLAPGEMLRATLLSNLELALLFSLPVLTLGALSKTVTEALVTALAALLFVLLATLVGATFEMTVSHSFHLDGPTDDTGIAWMVGFLRHAVLILTAAAVVGLQYYRRDTRTSRIVLAAGLLVFAMVGRLPWQPAFALQKALSPQPDAGRAVVLKVAASAAGTASSFALQDADSEARQRPVRGGRQRLILGIEVEGLPAEASLHADRVALRVLDGAGATLYRGTGQDWDLRAGNRTASLRQVIDLPKNVYARSADRPVRIEIDYSLTLLKARVLSELSAIDGNAMLEGVGRCASRLDEDGGGFEVGCDAAGELPPCFSLSLRRDDKPELDEETFVCDLDYAPVAWRFSVEPIERFVRKLSLKDGSQAAVSGSPLPPSRGAAVVFRRYDAVAHFSRRVTVADVHLSDFAGEPQRP
jgi:hypothetical protein